jgi:hypothetical protein
MRVPARRRPIAAPNSLACELQILLTLRVAPARLRPFQRRAAPAEHDGDGGVLDMARLAELEDLGRAAGSTPAAAPTVRHGAADSKGSSGKGLLKDRLELASASGARAVAVRGGRASGRDGHRRCHPTAVSPRLAAFPVPRRL